jgi:pimeloyl-ACP methyl ester carboxylesterase
MKKIIVSTLVIILVLLSPVLYLLYTFAFTGPISDQEFQQDLPSIVNNLEVKFDGEGEETLVMIHGWPDSLELWDKQVEFLKQNYRIARFTLPGFELEDNGKRPHYNVQQIRTIIDSFIRSLNQENVTVLAHDWGAIYAFQYLEKNDLVSRMILFDIGGFGDEKLPTINMKYTFAFAVAWVLHEFFGEKLIAYTAENIVKIEDVDPNKTFADLRVDPSMTYPYWHMWNSVLSKNSVKAIAVEDYGSPFLFIYGEDKKIWFHSKSWEQKIQTLNKGQVESVPGGHWFMQSSPDLVNQKISKWLSAK